MTNDKDTVDQVASIIGGMLYNEILPYFRVDPDLFLGDVEAGDIVLSASREVLSALQPAIEAAVLKERERCAKIAEGVPNLSHPSDFAAAIRETSND